MTYSKIFKVDHRDVANIKWKDDSTLFDLELFSLGKGYKKFIVPNPYLSNKNLFDFIEPMVPLNPVCVVWKYRGEWIQKLFDHRWSPKKDKYVEVEVEYPELEWKVNPALPKDIEFLDDPRYNFKISKGDESYELIWFIKGGVWALKATAKGKRITGTKSIDTIELREQFEYDENLSFLDVTCNVPAKKDFWLFEHRWIIFDGDEKITVAKIKYTSKTVGFREYEVKNKFERPDVIFISYNEPNADKNWQRVLERAPWAKRVQGVTGIFNAHKAAARLATTEMFYVVDGDAWLTDDFDFDFEPSIFNRDCAFVWHSKNPVNGLEYGYGGVKLFPRRHLLTTKTWKGLDFFTSVNLKISVVEEVSCITNFNSDSYSTWRAAFRESVKLYNGNQPERLDKWLHPLADVPFREYAVQGAKDAVEFCKVVDKADYALINNEDWLLKKFNK